MQNVVESQVPMYGFLHAVNAYDVSPLFLFLMSGWEEGLGVLERL